VETLGKVRVEKRFKCTVKTQVKREGVDITTHGKTHRNSLQINIGKRNDPTLIIHA
jgi:ribosomal protein L35